MTETDHNGFFTCSSHFDIHNSEQLSPGKWHRVTENILTFSCRPPDTDMRTSKFAITILSLLTWSCITWQLSKNLINEWRHKEECYWYSPSQNCNQSTVQTSHVDNQEYPKTGCGQRLHSPGPHTQRTCNMYSAVENIIMTGSLHNYVTDSTQRSLSLK